MFEYVYPVNLLVIAGRRPSTLEMACRTCGSEFRRLEHATTSAAPSGSQR